MSSSRLADHPPPGARFSGWSRCRAPTMRGALDRRLHAACVSCGAITRNWHERLLADDTAELRAALGDDGRPVLRARLHDACQVCGGPEIEIGAENADPQR